MRPLIGMDKVEIERIARQIGTFEISTQPAAGCSAVPQYPETRAELEEVLKAEENLNIPALVESALAELKVVKL
jgi:thiamine biosynthesis protein ThiI